MALKFWFLTFEVEVEKETTAKMSTVRKSTFMSNAAAITAKNFTLAKLWVSLFW